MATTPGTKRKATRTKTQSAERTRKRDVEQVKGDKRRAKAASKKKALHAAQDKWRKDVNENNIPRTRSIFGETVDNSKYYKKQLAARKAKKTGRPARARSK